MMTVNRLELEADLCKQSFFDFFLRFWQVVSGEQLVPNWHIEILCNELQTAASRVIGTVDPVTLKRKRQYKEYDLIINVPPGSTKSTICSVMFPVWCWLHDPTLRFICGSHTDELSMYLAGLCNRLILSEKFKELYPQIKLTKTTGHWLETKQGGWRLCTSTNASIIGKHAHIQIIDDPLDPKGSLSEADMKAANNWMDHTLPTRMVDLRVSLLILVMQRLGEDDPTGHKLAKTGGTPIRHICLPAVLLDKTTKVRPRALRRYYIDDLFDPVRLPLEVLKAKENGDMGTYAYAGQYMQNPIPAGGAMFQTSALQIHKAAPKMIRMIRYWDKAGTGGKGAWTVGLLMGVDRDGCFWVLDVVRGQWEAAEREKRIFQTAKLDGRGVLIGIEQEPGSGGKESAQASVKMLAGYRVRVDRPVGDKVLRADPFAIQVNRGNVRMLAYVWASIYLNELQFFPHSKFKDQVDASSGAFACLTSARFHVGAY